jgi:hypothetical protein
MIVDHVPATIKSENPSVKCRLSTLSRSEPPCRGRESPTKISSSFSSFPFVFIPLGLARYVVTQKNFVGNFVQNFVASAFTFYPRAPRTFKLL